MTKRTFVYKAYVAPKKPKVVKTAPTIKTTKVAAAKPKPVPVDTSNYTTAIINAVQKFTLYHNAATVVLLDKIATQIRKVDYSIPLGNAKVVQQNINKLLQLFAQNHKSAQLQLAPTGSIMHSKSVFNLAHRTVRNSVYKWLEPGDVDGTRLVSFEMMSMHFSDAADCLHIANYIRLGQRLLANRILQSMDTAPREEISLNAYNWIADHSDSRLYK